MDRIVNVTRWGTSIPRTAKSTRCHPARSPVSTCEVGANTVASLTTGGTVAETGRDSGGRRGVVRTEAGAEPVGTVAGGCRSRDAGVAGVILEAGAVVAT